MKRIELSEVQLKDIQNLALDKRSSLGFSRNAPIANDIFTILDRLDIILLEYPIDSEKDRKAFSAVIMYSEEAGQKLAFIGLNTADYFDKQIFAIAHELYHFYSKSGSHISRPDEVANIIEEKANRFAAEFLLPESVLKDIVFDEFSMFSLQGISHKALLRFIARLHCTWWLPYRSLVRRLYEINAISERQYDELYSVDERDKFGEFGKTARATNKDVFLKLNQSTNNIGTSPNEVELIIRNFEDELIDEDQFVHLLGLFNKVPDDFGYQILIDQEDQDELDAYFGGETDEG